MTESANSSGLVILLGTYGMYSCLHFVATAVCLLSAVGCRYVVMLRQVMVSHLVALCVVFCVLCYCVCWLVKRENRIRIRYHVSYNRVSRFLE